LQHAAISGKIFILYLSVPLSKSSMKHYTSTFISYQK